MGEDIIFSEFELKYCNVCDKPTEQHIINPIRPLNRVKRDIQAFFENNGEILQVGRLERQIIRKQRSVA